jgi:acetyl-CoA C-acetyltransferase
MTTAYIVEAIRTAGGRRKGKLATIHPADLAALTLDGIVARTGLDPAAIDDVIMGCVTEGGEQTGQIGRSAVLASKLPITVPAVTIDRQCGSSQQAIQFAAQAVMSGTQDVVIAAGVESMTRVPMNSTVTAYEKAGIGMGPWSEAMLKRFGIKAFSQFQGAQMIADKYGFAREELDTFALKSHRNSAAAAQRGDFAREILPVLLEGGMVHDADEGIRFDASLEALAALEPIMLGGSITAGNASQMCDGAAAVLIVSEAALKTHALTPLARIDNFTVTAGDPVIMLEEPINATRRALKRAGRSLNEIDLYEVNEAFAPIPLAWQSELGADPDRLNVNGGAIALGHPLGASGAKLMATLVHALHARNKRFGLQTMCEGGGIANVTIIERL